MYKLRSLSHNSPEASGLGCQSGSAILNIRRSQVIASVDSISTQEKSKQRYGEQYLFKESDLRTYLAPSFTFHYTATSRCKKGQVKRSLECVGELVTTFGSQRQGVLLLKGRMGEWILGVFICFAKAINSFFPFPQAILSWGFCFLQK